MSLDSPIPCPAARISLFFEYTTFFITAPERSLWKSESCPYQDNSQTKRLCQMWVKTETQITVQQLLENMLEKTTKCTELRTLVATLVKKGGKKQCPEELQLKAEEDAFRPSSH